MKKYVHHSCSFCGNDWTIEDGFNLKSKQCPPCDSYDLEEPKKKLERERIAEWVRNHPEAGSFKYVSGDPYW